MGNSHLKSHQVFECIVKTNFPLSVDLRRLICHTIATHHPRWDLPFVEFVEFPPASAFFNGSHAPCFRISVPDFNVDPKQGILEKLWENGLCSVPGLTKSRVVVCCLAMPSPANGIRQQVMVFLEDNYPSWPWPGVRPPLTATAQPTPDGTGLAATSSTGAANKDVTDGNSA